MSLPVQAHHRLGGSFQMDNNVDSKYAVHHSERHHLSVFTRARRVMQTLNHLALTDVRRNMYVDLWSLTRACAG